MNQLKYDKVIISPHKENLIRMRDVKIETEYCIMLQDDHWLFDNVDNKKIETAIEYAKKYNVGNLRLLQDPKNAEIFEMQEELMIYPVGKAYRISARGGLWKTEYFMKFVSEYKDLWELEQCGQGFAEKMSEIVLATKYRTLPIIDAVHKGYYEDFALFMLDANRIETDRPKASGITRLKEVLKCVIWEINPDAIAKAQGYLHFGYKKKY